jgi:glycosyltransferase involved in cell wall biosynthesis
VKGAFVTGSYPPLRCRSALDVCLVTQQFPPEGHAGGIATYTKLLAEGLVEAGCRVTVLTQSLTRRPARDRQGDLSVLRIPNLLRSPVPSAIARALTVRRALELFDRRFDAIEYPSWAGEGAFVPSSAAPVLAVRLVTTVRTVRSYWKAKLKERLATPLLAALESRSVRRAQLRMSGTAAHAGSAAVEFAIPLASIEVVPFGVPLAPRVAGPSDPIVTIVGRLEPRKGTDLALEAAARVTRAVPNARFIFAGEIGRDRHGRSYQDVVASDRRLKDAVRLLGPVDEADVHHLRRKSRVILVPSLSESFGLTYLEAMAAGRPLVAFDIPAAREVLAGAPVPLVAPNADALAAAVMNLLADDVACDELAEAGWTFVRDHYTAERMIAATVEAYRAAAARAV